MAGYLIRYNGGPSHLRVGMATTAPLTGSAQTIKPGGATISASSGLTLFCAALAFAVWGVMTLGLTFVAGIIIGIFALGQFCWRSAKQMWGAHRVCAWCKCTIGGNPFAKATHGICPTCQEIEMSKIANAQSDSLRRTRTGTAALVLLFSAFVASAQTQDSRLKTPDCIRAIVGEAANQGRDGMLAVAGAIRNRGTLKGVYGFKNPIADRQSPRTWTQARLAWAMSATNDISRGATHWENIGAFGEPRWAKSLTVTTNIGAHTFYK